MTATNETMGKRPPSFGGGHAVQGAMLQAMMDRRVELTLLDGSVVKGTLKGVDTYSLALREEGQRAPTLVYKQCVAMVRVVGQ